MYCLCDQNIESVIDYRNKNSNKLLSLTLSVYDKEHLYLNFLTKIFQKSSSIPRINKNVIFPQMSTQYLRLSPRIWCQYGTSNLREIFSGVPQIRESDGDSKKIYEHKRKRGFIDS